MTDHILISLVVSVIVICITVVMGLLVNHTPEIKVESLVINITLQLSEEIK